MNTNKPTIPASELRQDRQLIQIMTQEKDLDLVLANGYNRAVFGPAHVRWLADILVHVEPLCGLMPKNGDPLLLSGLENDEYARLRGQMPDVRVLVADGYHITQTGAEKLIQTDFFFYHQEVPEF